MGLCHHHRVTELEPLLVFQFYLTESESESDLYLLQLDVSAFHIREHFLLEMGTRLWGNAERAVSLRENNLKTLSVFITTFK